MIRAGSVEQVDLYLTMMTMKDVNPKPLVDDGKPMEMVWLESREEEDIHRKHFRPLWHGPFVD